MQTGVNSTFIQTTLITAYCLHSLFQLHLFEITVETFKDTWQTKSWRIKYNDKLQHSLLFCSRNTTLWFYSVLEGINKDSLLLGGSSTEPISTCCNFLAPNKSYKGRINLFGSCVLRVRYREFKRVQDDVFPFKFPGQSRKNCPEAGHKV